MILKCKKKDCLRCLPTISRSIFNINSGLTNLLLYTRFHHEHRGLVGLYVRICYYFPNSSLMSSCFLLSLFAPALTPELTEEARDSTVARVEECAALSLSSSSLLLPPLKMFNWVMVVADSRRFGPGPNEGE